MLTYTTQKDSRGFVARPLSDLARPSLADARVIDTETKIAILFQQWVWQP